LTIHYFHRIPLADLRGVWPCSSKPACSICEEPVELETAKTDECGRAIHENCYVLKLISSENAGPAVFSKQSVRQAPNAVPRFAILNVAGGRTMTDQERERLAYLCERIQIERAPKTFDELVLELNELLEQKQRRIEPAQANSLKN
jgi:hypothetical protein